MVWSDDAVGDFEIGDDWGGTGDVTGALLLPPPPSWNFDQKPEFMELVWL